MADNTPGFNSLDPLGPEYGKINQPIIDPKGLSPFEGDRMRDAPINFPAMPGLDLSLPNRNVRQNAVGAPGKPANANKQATAQDVINAQGSLIKAIGQASQSKDSYAKIYSYNAGPDGNAFYKRYQAYGQEKFDEIGFSPLRDNEATFNARTTRWDDFSRMMTHSFFPLLASGFTSGPRSLFRMLQGDFTGADLEDARLYEEAAAIGQSSKGGVFGFVNNTVMNFGYTVGIISEVILEEMGAALLAPGTGGTSFAAATIRNLERIKGVGTAIKGFKAMRNSLSELKGIQAVRNFKNSVNAGLTSKVGRFLNPLENTFEALQLAKADNLTGLAATFKTAGGLYRDIRTVNMAVSEARLEAGMVENSVYDDLYNEHYNLTGEAPDNKTQQDMQRQAKDASGNTFYWNAGLIYATNKITFNNITGPRGGIRKFIKSVQDDFVSVGGGKFGNVGKIVYDNVAKKFAYEATNLKNLAKSWWKNPGFKTASKTIGYFKANISEGLQENMQEIISRTNEGYYKDSFNSKARRAQEYARGAALYAGKTQSDYFKKEIGEEFSMKGLETFGSGFFMGMLAAPLNNSIPFLSKQWNRMFDQKGYTDYVEKKEKMAEGIVEVLNNIDMKDFIKSNMFNLSAQDFINEIKARASKKEGMDAELEGLIDSVEMMLQTNTTDVFTDHLNSFFDLSEDEFMEAMGNIEKSEIPEYKTRITKSIDKIKSIKKKYDYYKEKKPNPVTDAYLSTLDKDSEEYEEAVSLQAGWDRAVKNAVFFNEAYEDTMQRMVDIQSEFLSKTTLKNMGAREMGLIFQPQKIKNEIELLKNDIEVAEQAKSTLPGAAEDLAKKKRMLAQMEDYAEKFKAFDIFYNRTDYYSAHRDEVKKQLGIDLTDEEVEAIFNEQLGALDGTESQAKVLGELKESLANYLKTVANINEDTVFDESIDKGFTLLTDHYKLYRESLAMVEAINTLHDPGNFSDLARRNQAWMKDLYNRRAEYYEKIVKGEMEDVEFNALLNKLADSGIAVTPEDFVEWKNNRTIPKEFIDIANKRIIPQNSEKYAAAVDLFERATALRDDTTVVSTEIQDAEYKRQLAALEADMQAEIDALPKVEERLVTGSIEPTAKSKSFTLNKVRKELAIGEQAELVDTKGERIIVRKDENEQLVDEAGELVDNNKRYVAGEKFRMSMVADEAAVKEIEDRYTEKRIALKEKFLAAQENVEKPQVVEEMTIADIMTKEPELYQQLLTAYEAMMVEDMGVDDFATLSDSQRENGLAKFIKSAKGKLIVDAYQEKQKISRSTQTEANEMTFTLDGTSYDTSTITSVPQLRNFIKQFNAKIATIKKKKIQDSADTEAILDLQSMINGMNLLIDKRLQSGATDELKAAIAKIKVMQLNQKDIVKQDLKSITIPKDDRAWKKGDIRYTKQGIRVEYKGDNLYNIAGEDRVFDTSTPNASSFQRSIDTAIYTANPQEVPNVYMIKGTEHERVSYAIKSVYDVFGLNENSLAILNTAFDVTIGTKGFNEESIKAFVDDLRATKESDNGKLGGFSTYTFDEIEGDLLGFYDSMTIMGGAPTTAPINFYQIDSGQIRVSTGDDGSRMVDITSEDFNQIVSQLSPEQKEKFKEYLRAEIAKTSEKLEKASKIGGYMASNSTQQNILKFEKELKETLAALEGTTTSEVDPKRADVEARLRKLAVALKEEEIKQVLDIPIEKIITEVKNLANNNPNTLVGSLVVYYALRLRAEMGAIRIPVGEKTKLVELVKVIDKLTPSATSNIDAEKADVERKKLEINNNRNINKEQKNAGAPIMQGQEGKWFAYYTPEKDKGYIAFDTQKEALAWIDAKYDAELSALDNTTTAGVFTPSTPYGTAKGAPLTTASTTKRDFEKEIEDLNNEINNATLHYKNMTYGSKEPNNTAKQRAGYKEEAKKALTEVNALKGKLKALEEAQKDAAQATTFTQNIESFETSKGSVYTVLPDGKVKRFKTATGEQQEPAELIVFVKFDNARQEQEFLSAQNRQEGTKLYVVDSEGNIYNKNSEVVGKNVKLAIVKDNKVLSAIDASTEPKVGYNTFDQRRFEKDGEKYRSTHLGNTVTKINYKKSVKAESVGQTTAPTVDIEEIRKLALNTAAEQSYEASKKVGNYTDAQSKRIFDGEAPEFDEERITKEAYDELFDPKTGYLTQLKERADKGEFFIATDIVVYGEVVDANGKTRRIAGEIDLLIADRDGKIHIIDLKTGTYSKWQFYNNKGTIGYNKRIENTLQQMSYSNLVFNQYGLETNIGILPIEAKYDPDSADGKIMKAGRPTTKKLFEDDDMSLLESNKPFSVKLYKNQELQQLDENGEVVNTTAEELIGKIIPRKDGKSGASGPIRPDEDSTEDEAGPTGGTNAPNPTVNKGAREDQVATYNDLKERIMMANLDELEELNPEVFAAKGSGGITEEQYKDLVILLEEAETQLSIEEIEAVSINNVKLNSKLIAMDEFTTTTQKGKTTIINIIGANEKVVVAEILKDSIKVRTQDGNLVEVPANKISDIFVDAAKYEDEPGGPMDTPYKPTKEESIVITQTNDNVATFLDDNDAKTEAVQKGQSMNPKDALNDLNKIINCPG